LVIKYNYIMNIVFLPTTICFLNSHWRSWPSRKPMIAVRTQCPVVFLPTTICFLNSLKLDSIYMYVTNYLFNDKYKHVGIRYYLLYGLHVVVNVQNVFVWYFLTSLTVNNQYWLFSSFNKCLKSHQYVVSDPTQETK
jgi:hypothetical protein